MIAGRGALAAAIMLAAVACRTEGTKDEVEPGLLDRAAADLLSENYSSAAFKYEQFLRVNPETSRRAWIYAQVGLCRNGAGDYEGAIRNFDQALVAGPDPVLRLQIRYRRAIAQNFLDRPEGALSDLEEVQLAPKELRDRAVKTTEFLRILGVTEIRAGFWPRGQKTFRELVEKHPQSQEAVLVKPLLMLKAFTVQVAGCADEKAARARVTEFLKKGIVARILDLPERPGVAVVSGEFARYPDAVRERARIRAMGIDAFILP
ncbi:MAG: SPOR domain-containing protein [Planctomycetes bacterium]|nr:SPOR domain-containing protein [Planctomycetota bacterium]